MTRIALLKYLARSAFIDVAGDHRMPNGFPNMVVEDDTYHEDLLQEFGGHLDWNRRRGVAVWRHNGPDTLGLFAEVRPYSYGPKATALDSWSNQCRS